MFNNKKLNKKNKRINSYYEGFEQIAELKDVLIEMKRYQF
jgi:hypothetical protein